MIIWATFYFSWLLYFRAFSAVHGNIEKDVNSFFQVSMMEKDSYLGRILTGRISSGVIRVGDRVHGLRSTDSGVSKIEEGKVCGLILINDIKSVDYTISHLYSNL